MNKFAGIGLLGFIVSLDIASRPANASLLIWACVLVILNGAVFIGNLK